MADNKLNRHRAFLKDSLRLQIDFSQTDQSRGVEPPPLQKPPRKDQRPIPLPGQDSFDALRGTDLVDAISQRRSHRHFLDQPLSLEELSWLLWATQGVTEILSPSSALRTVPSAGCRHVFETYLAVMNVASLDQGIYRYLPLDHKLAVESLSDDLAERLSDATLGQSFIAAAPVTFIWSAIPYRMEWRYGLAAHRVILIDAGHVCQNLYLACEAVPAGTCAVAAYDQERMDTLLGLDGNDECVIYLAAVGKPG